MLERVAKGVAADHPCRADKYQSLHSARSSTRSRSKRSANSPVPSIFTNAS
jgi:hypothetical protein